nr:hypothetical protein Itr_chr05CG17000 [Ipomoea trifida]
MPGSMVQSADSRHIVGVDDDECYQFKLIKKITLLCLKKASQWLVLAF